MDPSTQVARVGGRLAVDFANLGCVFSSGLPRPLTWTALIAFLEATDIVAAERGSKLLTLPQADPQAAEALLAAAARLQVDLRKAFHACVVRTRLERSWIDTVNVVLRVTEGHEELAFDG